MVDVIRELGHLEKLAKETHASGSSDGYAREPDTGITRPSGSEGAGRKRTPAMGQRAALPPYSLSF
jgi:hypothetical protein